MSSLRITTPMFRHPQHRPIDDEVFAKEIAGREDAVLWRRNDAGVWEVMRDCRACGETVAFDFPGGVRPGLLRFLGSVVCAKCEQGEREEEERQAARENVRRLVKSSGMPAALMGEVGWDSLVAASPNPGDAEKRQLAIDAAKAWAGQARPAKGLLLYGPAGSGKTRLAATAARARLEAGRPIRWVSVGVLMAELEGGWNDDDRKAALKVLSSSDAVVLDDFDKVAVNARSQTQIFTALDKREQARQGALIVTTNKPPRELAEKFGDVVASRLMGMCLPLPYPGPDRRLPLEEV